MGQYVKCSKKDLSLEQTWDRKEGIKPLASLTKMTEGKRGAMAKPSYSKPRIWIFLSRYSSWSVDSLWRVESTTCAKPFV